MLRQVRKSTSQNEIELAVLGNSSHIKTGAKQQLFTFFPRLENAYGPCPLSIECFTFRCYREVCRCGRVTVDILYNYDHRFARFFCDLIRDEIFTSSNAGIEFSPVMNLNAPRAVWPFPKHCCPPKELHFSPHN